MQCVRQLVWQNSVHIYVAAYYQHFGWYGTLSVTFIVPVSLRLTATPGLVLPWKLFQGDHRFKILGKTQYQDREGWIGASLIRTEIRPCDCGCQWGRRNFPSASYMISNHKTSVAIFATWRTTDQSSCPTLTMFGLLSGRGSSEEWTNSWRSGCNGSQRYSPVKQTENGTNGKEASSIRLTNDNKLYSSAVNKVNHCSTSVFVPLIQSLPTSKTSQD